MPDRGKSPDEPSDESDTARFTARDLVSRYREERDDPRGFTANDADAPVAGQDFGDDFVEEFTDDFDDDSTDDFTDEEDPADRYGALGDPDDPDAQFADDDYPEFPRRAEADPSSPSDPRPGLTATGRRVLGEWRGGHRSASGRRGVSVGVIVALVAVIVVVGTIILWRFFGDALSNRSHTAAARCVGGKEDVAVIVDPSMTDLVQQFAEGYNSTAGPVGDKCMVVNVKPAGSDAVINGFIGKWPAELGARPALWIPGSSVSAARLTAAAGQKTVSDSRSLVTSPVVLAIRPELQPALADQTWGALPGLQTNPNSLAGLKLPGWGGLRLAIPTSGNGDAAYLAGEAVAAASVPPGAPATQGTAALRALTAAQPKLSDNSLIEALNALLKPGDAATAPVHAVITTEQQLFQRGQSLSDANKTLTGWLPPGPAPVADYPTVLLSGSWLTSEQTSAASEFAHFIRKPDQLAKLAKAGFRVNGVKSPSSPVTSFAPVSATLSVGDDAMRVTLADAMSAPSSGVAATIMLDQSMPGDEGGKSRLANVIAALQDRIKALPPTATVGLWTFDGHEGRSEVTTGALTDPVNGQPRSTALSAALDKQYSSAGGAVSFTTLRLIYQDMQTNYRAGQNNSILVITAGPHTDQTLDGPGLQNFIRTSADPAKPIAVNVVDFGADPDRATWEVVAQLSGGSYQNLATSASPDLTTVIRTFLS